MMESGRIERTCWAKLPIVCPGCGNKGHQDGSWRRYSAVPFRIAERVVRSFSFAAEVDRDGVLGITADVDTDTVDCSSGTGFQFECMQCGHLFDMPEGVVLDID